MIATREKLEEMLCRVSLFDDSGYIAGQLTARAEDMEEDSGGYAYDLREAADHIVNLFELTCQFHRFMATVLSEMDKLEEEQEDEGEEVQAGDPDDFEDDEGLDLNVLWGPDSDAPPDLRVVHICKAQGIGAKVPNMVIQFDDEIKGDCRKGFAEDNAQLLCNALFDVLPMTVLAHLTSKILQHTASEAIYNAESMTRNEGKADETGD